MKPYHRLLQIALIITVALSLPLYSDIGNADTDALKKEAKELADSLADDQFKPANQAFVEQMATGVGFVTATGHVMPCGIGRGKQKWRFGAGLNLAFTMVTPEQLDNMISGFAGSDTDTGISDNFLFPTAANAILNFKLNILNPWNWDIGGRVAFFPTLTINGIPLGEAKANVSAGWMLMGLQFRMNSWTIGPLELAWGVNVDTFLGGYSVGASYSETEEETVSGESLKYTMEVTGTLKNNWFNIGISPNMTASLNLPVLNFFLKPFAGIGAGFNIGEVTSTSDLEIKSKVEDSNDSSNNEKFSLNTTLGEETKAVDAVNMRFMYGTTLLWMSLIGESDILFRSHSFTLHLVHLEF